MENEVIVQFPSLSQYERLARMIVSSFMLPYDPTFDEMNDVKTVVSEAVSNAVIHGYEKELGIIELRLSVVDGVLKIVIKDEGQGIEDVEQVKEPLFTTKPDCERSGMGFTIMEQFMDHCHVVSSPDVGTVVTLEKVLLPVKLGV